jgi:hypothetical protein
MNYANHPTFMGKMLSRVNLCIALQWYLGSLGKLSVSKFVDALDTASKIDIVALGNAKSIVDKHIQEYGHCGMVDYQPSYAPCAAYGPHGAYGPRWVFTPFKENDFSYSDPHVPMPRPNFGRLTKLTAFGASDTYPSMSPETTFFRVSYRQHTPPPSLKRQTTPTTYSKSERRQFARQRRTHWGNCKHPR